MKIEKISISKESSPPQGLSEARRGREFYGNQSLIRRGGAPSGAAAFIKNGLRGLFFYIMIFTYLM
jgi:hypothetical protein